MYFIDGAKTNVKVELVGGPLDGLAVDCPLAPPPLLPAPNRRRIGSLSL